MRPLIAYPLTALFLALTPACGEKHSLGELTGNTTDASTTETTGEQPETTGKPLETTGELPESTGEPPDITGEATATGSTTGDPAACESFADEASCMAAGCEFVKGRQVVADENGCGWGEAIGFCASEVGGADVEAMYCTPGPDPAVVVFSFDPFNIPGDWTSCGCADVDGPLAAGCADYVIGQELDGCPRMEAHCGGLGDEASCDQFQGEAGLNGCLWLETTIEVAADMACSAAPPVGRCLAVRVREADEGCKATVPPASCEPGDAEKQPYFGRVEDLPPQEQLELIDDVPCEFEPLAFTECWNGEGELAGCECPCSP